MKRVILALAVLAFSSSFEISRSLGNDAAKAKPQSKPRYVAAQHGRPGQIDMEQYLRIDDPKEAARVLLEESRLAGLDVDQRPQSPPRETVFLGGISRQVDKKDRSMADRASSLVMSGKPDTPIICVLKMSRELTIRETADLMAMGVRLYRSIPFYAYIAEVTADQATRLRGIIPLESMSELKPEDKYPTSRRFESKYPIAVYSLVGDRSECRNDLKQLGGEVIGAGTDGLYHHKWEAYSVRIDPKRIPEIAALWWVQMINQANGEDAPESDYEPTDHDSLNEAVTFGSRLVPFDSRRLVSVKDWTNPGKYTGKGLTVLIYEYACDWNHNDLSYKRGVTSDPVDLSDPAVNHGTMVAGVAAGGINSAVTGGGIAGVAAGADFYFLKHIRGDALHPDLEAAIQYGLWLTNHSWGRLDSLDVYDDRARRFDELAEDYKVVLVKSSGDDASAFGYGNQPGLPRTISSPGTGKNVLTVGAIKYVPDEAQGDTLGQVTPYSGRGPTLEGVLKPELVAPGGTTVGACAEGGVISCSSTATVPVCQVWDTTRKYMSDAGSSYAAPHVTGALALIDEAYKDWYNQSVGTNACAGCTMSGELMRALVINTSIPLKWNGAWPDNYKHYGTATGDTVATSSLLAGFANTDYGYGLVNAYSGVNSPETEYKRVLVWQSTATQLNDPIYQQKVFSLRLRDQFGNYVRPKYLVVTLAYNDLPGKHVIDSLRLSLQEASPGNRTFTYTPPIGLDAGTVQKIVIPRPRGGDWTAKVTFSTSSSRLSPSRDFAVVVDALMDVPQLGWSSTLKSVYDNLKTGQALDLPVGVINNGKNVAAGVTVFVEDPNNLSTTDTNHAFYIGNLLKNGDGATKKIHVVTPSTPGDYQVTVVVDAINKMMSGGPYPLRKVITLKVKNFKGVSGHITMVPGFNATLAGADILIDGVPSGKKTASDGSYSVDVSSGFTGKIKARKGTTVFIPLEHTFAATPVNTTVSGKDYQAEYRTISGRIVDENGARVAGITVIPKPDVATMRASQPLPTDSNGNFSCYTEHDWAGTFVPLDTLSYLTYTPANIAYAHFDSLVTNITDLNFSTRRVALWGDEGTQVAANIATVNVAPECVGDEAGGGLITWSDANDDVRAQRLGPSGSKLWNGTVEKFCTATGEQRSPHAIRLSDGTFLLCWNDKRSGAWDIYAQHLDANGNAMWTQNGIAVCQSTGDQQNIRFVGASDYAVAVWEDKRNGTADIYAQRINSDGTMSWGANGVAVCSASGDQLAPSVALTSSGLAFVIWQDKRPGVSGGSDTYMQGVGTQGTAQWTSNGILVSASNYGETAQQVALAGDGSCLFCYDTTGLNANGYSIEINRFGKISPSGQLLWQPLRSNVLYEASTSMIGDGSGGAFMLSAQYYSAKPLGWVAHYDANGATDWRATFDGHRVESGVMKGTGEGGVIVLWQTLEEPNKSTTDIIAQKYDPQGCPLWGRGLKVAATPDKTERLPYLADDQLSGSIICWNDSRSGSPNVYASHINEYAPAVYSVSGTLRDNTGATVSGVEVLAENQAGVLTSRTSKTDGTYSLSIPAFWKGDVHVRPRGILNAASPSVVPFGPALAPMQSNFTLSHQATHWQKDGLLVSTANLFGGPGYGKIFLAGSNAGSLLAWDNGADTKYVQFLTPSGDIRWTQNGDPLQSMSQFSQQKPKAVATNGSNFIVVWSDEAGVYGQLLDPNMTPLWDERGVAVIPTAAEIVEACSDLNNGAFVFAYNATSQKTYLQHLTSTGTNAWTQAIYVFGFPVSTATPPVLCPDGAGGVLVSWLSQANNYLYVQRVNGSGGTMWGGTNSWEPLTVRANAFIAPVGTDIPNRLFDMVGDGHGGAYLAWSEHSQANSTDERIRVSWIYYQGQRLNGNGTEFTTQPGRQWIADMAGPVTEYDGGFYLLYDDFTGGLVGRLVLQNISPGIDGTVGHEWNWPASGVTIAPPGPRLIGDAKIVKETDKKAAIVVWREAPASVFAQAVDSVGTAIWLTRNYQVTSNVDLTRPMSVASDKHDGAYLAWCGTDGGLYASRINESEVIQGGATVATFVRRKANGIVEPISTARAVCCPKGEEDALIFDVKLSDQALGPLSANAFSVSWPAATGNFALRAFRPAIADSAMRLDGDQYRTTITVREIGGCGIDSVTVLANGLPIGRAPYNIISPDINTGSSSAGLVDLPDFSKFTTFYQVGNDPKPYSDTVDYVSVGLGLGSTRPDGQIQLGDFSYFSSHWGHHKAADLLVAGERTASSAGQVELHFTETQVDGNRVLKVGVSLAGVEPFTVAYFALRNANPLFEFADWHQNPAYPYMTLSAPAVRDGDRLVAIGAVAPKTATAWNGELGTIDLKVSSSAPLELTNDDFALLTGELMSTTGDVLSVSMRDRKSPPKFGNSLSQNYPNPFNPTTTINYSIASAGHVDLIVFDVRGAVVKRLVNGERKPNMYHVVWDGTDNRGTHVASGIYFYRLRAPKFTMSKKMVLLK
jgi:Subtilase family/FlgD Ig-like domain